MKKFKFKKQVSLILAAVLASISICGCNSGDNAGSKKINIPSPSGCDIQLSAAFLYCGDEDDFTGMYSQLEQNFTANLDVEKVSTDKKTPDFTKYDIIYLDDSIIGDAGIKEPLVEYVENGGYLFLANEFLTYFEPEFLGAKEVVKLKSVPKNLEFPEAPENLGGMQGLIKDFETIYKHYLDYTKLSEKDYGYGIICDTAESLADFEGTSIYGVNRYGKGFVFYTNPILPNSFHITDLALLDIEDGQTHFSNSTATANRLMLSEFASYASKQKYGYAVNKILGSFGNPDMAWQLHYEEITGIENNSAILFGDMCKEYKTIPSFTLIRNSYKWFTKYESITYLLNNDGKFFMDFNENAYSSGKHVIEEDEYLSLCEIENGGSYFVDDYNFMQMAYPCVGDFNADGTCDIISGSSDGRFYYFEGIKYENEWKVAKRKILTDIERNNITVGEYSSPTVLDFDQDGVWDIISGSADGNIYLFRGIGDMQFEAGRVLISDINLERPMPCAGDLDGDGAMDIAVGSLDGKIKLVKSVQDGYRIFDEIICDDETFVAPYICDYNGDEKSDIIYGTFDGYIKRLKNEGREYVFDGYYDTEEQNYKGNNHIKFGNNCVPVLFDINGDKMADLIAGELEYGLAIPIDSPYFKYRVQLQNQVNYIKDNHFYLGAHFYTNRYASKEREAEELRLQKRAFDSYAIDYDCVGVNMHTWYVSNLAHSQTMQSAKDAGFLWNSGWKPSFSDASPEAAAETILASPFFMDFENREMMITNATVLGYTQFDDYAYMTAKYDLPLTEFYHCDFAYSNEGAGRNIIERVVDYKNKYCYNFVREDQFMKSAAAGYNIKLLSKTEENGKLTLSAEGQKDNYPLYDKNYQDCVGAKIDFADSVDVSKVAVNADVWRYDSTKNDLYIALNRTVLLDFQADGSKDGMELIKEDDSHIISVNIPADIELDGNKATVKFEDDGMMQVCVLGKVDKCKDGWDTEFENGVTTITKFGSESDLWFTFK